MYHCVLLSGYWAAGPAGIVPSVVTAPPPSPGHSYSMGSDVLGFLGNWMGSFHCFQGIEFRTVINKHLAWGLWNFVISLTSRDINSVRIGENSTWGITWDLGVGDSLDPRFISFMKVLILSTCIIRKDCVVLVAIKISRLKQITDFVFCKAGIMA